MWRASKPARWIAETTLPTSCSSPSGNTYRSMKLRRAKRARPSAVDPRAAGGRLVDGVVEETASGTEQLVATLEVARELSQPDVLEHADGADGVVRAVVDVSVVLVANLDLAGQPGFGGALLGQLRLPLRQRD